MGEPISPFRVSDMLKATITANNVAQLVNAYELLCSFDKEVLKIIKIKTNLKLPQKNVILNFIFMNELIGEI